MTGENKVNEQRGTETRRAKKIGGFVEGWRVERFVDIWASENNCMKTAHWYSDIPRQGVVLLTLHHHSWPAQGTQSVFAEWLNKQTREQIFLLLNYFYPSKLKVPWIMHPPRWISALLWASSPQQHQTCSHLIKTHRSNKWAVSSFPDRNVKIRVGFFSVKLYQKMQIIQKIWSLCRAG